MSPSVSAPASRPAGGDLPWWKVPMMWLVVGGPLLVVVASFATLTVAIKCYPDQIGPPVGLKAAPAPAVRPAGPRS